MRTNVPLMRGLVCVSDDAAIELDIYRFARGWRQIHFGWYDKRRVRRAIRRFTRGWHKMQDVYVHLDLSRRCLR